MDDINWTLIPMSNCSAWEAAVQRVDYSFCHTLDHCLVHYRVGETLHLFHASWSDGEVICPLIFRSNGLGEDIATPFGFSGFVGWGAMDRFPSWWRAFARAQGWVSGYLVVNPWLKGPLWSNKDGIHVHNVLFSIDLRCGESELHARLSRLRRRQLKRWEVADCELIDDRKEITEFIVAEREGFYRRINAVESYRLGELQWRALMGSSKLLTLGVRKQGRLIATTVFGLGKTMADALYNVATDEGKDAASYLTWKGALWLQAAGFKVLNMGGGLKKDDQIAESKRRFGGSEVPFGALRQIYDETRFKALCQMVGVPAVETGFFFPPYRSKSGLQKYVH